MLAYFYADIKEIKPLKQLAIILNTNEIFLLNWLENVNESTNENSDAKLNNQIIIISEKNLSTLAFIIKTLMELFIIQPNKISEFRYNCMKFYKFFQNSLGFSENDCEELLNLLVCGSAEEN